MAKRFRDTEIWDKDWFMKLSCKHKCLISFIFDKCDVAGIWEANWTLASLYVGQKCTESDLSFFTPHIKTIRPGKILVLDFIYFQYGRLSENSNPHVKIISILKKNNLYQGYLRGTLGVMEEDKEKDMDMDMDMDMEDGGIDLSLEQMISEIRNSYTLEVDYCRHHQYPKEIYLQMLTDFEVNCKEKQWDGTYKDLIKYLSNFNKVWKDKRKKNGKDDKRQADQIARDQQNEIARQQLNGIGNPQG